MQISRDRDQLVHKHHEAHQSVDSSTQEPVHLHHAHSDTSAVNVGAHTLPIDVQTEISTTLSPVNVELLGKLLKNHPNQELVDYVLFGLEHGFSLGFQGDVLQSTGRNLKSAHQNSEAVSKSIAVEVERGHTVGPFPAPPLDAFHCSPLGAVVKKDGSARLILDLSSPKGSSVNDGIDAETFAVKYCSFDEAVNMVRDIGPGAYMAKADIRHAFRLCPVSPEEYHLLGYSWNDAFYYDIRLPFGGRSSPFIFNSFADLLCWILHYVFLIAYVIHYLDDYFWCNASYDSCLRDKENLLECWHDLGVPIAPDKLEGPATSMIFLGIEIDSVEGVTRLPDEKLAEVLSILGDWHGKKKCTKRDLLSLIGSLSHAAKVIKPGRLFLRRLIDLSKTAKKLHHHIDISSEARLDIEWWIEFLPKWNGKEKIQTAPITCFDLELSTDASCIGIGGSFGNHWFSYPIQLFRRLSWMFQEDVFDINLWEMFALVFAVFSWGKSWQDKQIMIYVDNLSITYIWLRGCKCKVMMRLVRKLFLFTARHNINILLQHIPGHSNILADRLSRLQVQEFHQRLPTADPHSSPLPPEIWNL